mmetsp:Transcript_30986/g.71410  ORF Transcript_30986/g.71410 Transcript_30986/m.71410 type:complete len:87 (-) Transcript_30986:160-420(-)
MAVCLHNVCRQHLIVPYIVAKCAPEAAAVAVSLPNSLLSNADMAMCFHTSFTHYSPCSSFKLATPDNAVCLATGFIVQVLDSLGRG